MPLSYQQTRPKSTFIHTEIPGRQACRSLLSEQKRPQERIKYAENRGYGWDCRCAIAELTIENREWKISMVAQKIITDIRRIEGKPRSRGVAALPEFHYKNGYTLCLADLGKVGVKIELTDANEAVAAVILPPDKTQECSKWLSRTIGQRSHSLPEELSKILGRLLKWHEPSLSGEKEPKRVLERGDKKTIKEALRLLAAHS